MTTVDINRAEDKVRELLGERPLLPTDLLVKLRASAIPEDEARLAVLALLDSGAVEFLVDRTLRLPAA